MTPDLMEAGAKALEFHRQRGSAVQTNAEPYFGQGVALYVDGITVSFDGFRALNKLSLQSTSASCAASSAPTAPARRP